VTQDRNLGDRPQPGEADRRRTYIAVALLEGAVIVALWAFSRWFGAP